jgi:hypothetical protein
MTRDEILLFKQFDSDHMEPCRHTFHSAFKMNNLEESVRESCEVRCIAFFPNHEPNTIPEVLDEDLVARHVHRIMNSVNNFHKREEKGRIWIYTLLYEKENGVELLIRNMCKPNPNNGLETATEV